VSEKGQKSPKIAPKEATGFQGNQQNITERGEWF
jgi:hypothetical protein